MSEFHSESPLQRRSAPAGLAIDMREIADRGMIDLRGSAEDIKFAKAVHSVLHVELPTQPRSSISWGDIKILWLSTDQWLILCPQTNVAELVHKLRSKLGNIHSLVVDVSDMRAIIRLEGESVREVLLKGSSLDLLSPDYAAGTVRRLRFAEIAALLHVVEDQIFDLYVFRSYADYAWEFLLTAAQKSSQVKVFGVQSPPQFNLIS